MPDLQPIHIVTDTRGRQIDASPILREIRRLECEGDWTHPEVQTQIDELGGKLISATGTHHAPAALIARLTHHVSRAFRDHLRTSWERVSAECD